MGDRSRSHMYSPTLPSDGLGRSRGPATTRPFQQPVQTGMFQAGGPFHVGGGFAAFWVSIAVDATNCEHAATVVSTGPAITYCRHATNDGAAS